MKIKIKVEVGRERLRESGREGGLDREADIGIEIDRDILYRWRYKIES